MSMHVLSLRDIMKPMTKDELIAKLKTIVQPYIQDEQAFENLSENTDFINDLKINSANLVDVILDVEDEFDIRIENDDMEKMTSVKAAMEIINEKLAQK
jgi:acyl carrier protein